jgi:hypothetical protein
VRDAIEDMRMLIPPPVVKRFGATIGCLLAVAIGAIGLVGCAGKPLVRGFFEPGGVVYREAEQESWGSRSTLKVRGFDF